MPPFRPAILAALATLAALGPGAALADEITVFAAAALKTALDAVAEAWQADTRHTAVIAYAGSPALARQIQAGAPADLYISAAAQWMDVLEAEGLIAPGSRRDILGGALVLVAHGRDAAPVEIGPGFDLAGMLDGGRLAMAMVDSVPSGQYGKEALVSLGLWESVEAQVVQSENVRAALAQVARGEAPLGIVYASDAVADDGAGDQVSVVGTFPRGSHRPIVFPAAVIAGAAHPEAAADFLAYLSSDAAGAVFAAQGFEVPD